MTVKFESIESMDGNSLPAQVTMRYRLASDPDVDVSYTEVTATKPYLGMIVHDFDPTGLPDGEYVLHHFFTADGPATGAKSTFVIGDGAPL